MEITPRLLVYIWLPALLFSACPSEPDGPSPEKAYYSEILWEREVNRSAVSELPPLIKGQYCYLPASENYPGGGLNIVKINMEEKGRVEWESSRIDYISAEKIGSHIYLLGGSGLIFVLNDSDGKLAATVKLAENNAITSFVSSVAVLGPYLFWVRDGLMRFNSGLIDFSKPPGTIQNIAPEQIWSDPPQTRIFADFLLENGILYFFTRYYIYSPNFALVDFIPEIPTILIALDAETGDVIWERETPHCKGVGTGIGDNSLILNGDKLLVVEGAETRYFLDGETIRVAEITFSSYDKLTGVPVLENILLDNDEGGYSFGRIALYNNRLFYLVGRSELVSVNADTGDLIWSDFPSRYSTYASPLVNNGKVFMLHETGLRVYNADTGEFMGVDASFGAEYGVQFSHEIAIYKDAYIFFNERSRYVTAIRCK